MTSYLSSALTNGFYHSVDVLGCIDYAEAGALLPIQQDIIKLIVSAGYVDLRTGSKSKEILEGFFLVGTATRTALDALLASHAQPWTGENT